MVPFLLLTDGYKLGHPTMWPEGTTRVLVNFTARNGRDKRDKGVVALGIQPLLSEYFGKRATETFFNRPKDEVVAEYRKFVGDYASIQDVSHIEALHDLGYLPILFRSVPEGTFVPYGVPMLTMENTHPDFFWLPNYLETLVSDTLWQACTSATKARDYRKLLDEFAAKTSDAPDFVNFQAHDFSLRGMSSPESGNLSGLGHLVFFTGSDSLASIWFAQEMYGSEGFIAGGVPATEHSVMSAGGKMGERETFAMLMERYPNGPLSVVSDTWNLWKVLTEILPSLREQIMAREGTLVVRPDSGNPPDILCGDPTASPNSPEAKGVVQLLWEEFGGTVNSKGYKVLDSHVGTIYGDSITLDRAREICERLEAAGFASTNVVFGVGSYTYQMVTRDTHGFAMKATWVMVNGEERIVQKDPVTDRGGLKKSARGRVVVLEDPNVGLVLKDGIDLTGESGYRYANVLQRVWQDGEFYITTTLDEVREIAKAA